MQNVIIIPKRAKKPSVRTLKRAAQLLFEPIQDGDYSMCACLWQAANQSKTNYTETAEYCFDHRDTHCEKTSRSEASMFFHLLAEKLKDEQNIPSMLEFPKNEIIEEDSFIKRCRIVLKEVFTFKKE